MPLNAQAEQPAGPSRKRSHAEITKSESRSPSPHPPSKRRRTDPMSSSPRASLSADILSPGGTRFVGDGLDFRRPVMAENTTSDLEVQDTIDLTLDDDTPPPNEARMFVQPDDGHQFAVGAMLNRAPPFDYSNTQPEIIDLSDIDDNELQDRTAPDSRVEDSPDLEIVGERTRTPPPPLPIHGHRNISRRLPTPRASLTDLATTLSETMHSMFGVFRFNPGRGFDETTLDRIDGVPDGNGMRVTHIPAADLTIYDNVEMDYGQAGFNIGGGTPAQTPADRAYKEPAAARPGFTRTYDEEDVLVCGFCGNELAVGENDDDIRAQVWVIKQCGHAYCGACAHNRTFNKGANNRDRKRAATRKTIPFKNCTVPGCGKPVDSKTKMFQIYL